MFKKAKVSVLISDTAPLYPPLWGGPKRIWNLYSNLGDTFDITYVGTEPGFDKKYINRKIKDDFREVIQPPASIYYPFKRFELKIIKNLTFDIFTYLLMWVDKGFKKELNKYDADILISSHPWSSPCFNIRKGQIFIYDAHNCEYLLMKQILKGRWYRGLVSFFVRLIEKAACKKSKIILVTSKKDKESFVKLYKISEDKIFILPNGTCVEELLSEDKKVEIKSRIKRDNKPTILFIGAYYNPNIEAAKFIVEKIAPKLEDIDIAIVGTVSDYFRDNNVPQNVRLIGRVDDPELYNWLAGVDLAINPMFSGSGVNMKMLDYFSFSLPVVTTWVGARGIEGVNHRDFLACKEAEFVNKIRCLLNDESLSGQMGKNARLLAEKIYDWKKISSKFSNILRSLVKNDEINGDIDKKYFCWRNKV